MKNKKEIPSEFITKSDYWHENNDKNVSNFYKYVYKKLKIKIKEIIEGIFKINIRL